MGPKGAIKHFLNPRLNSEGKDITSTQLGHVVCNNIESQLEPKCTAVNICLNTTVINADYQLLYPWRVGASINSIWI
jgi:hypothetical protein